MLFQVLVRFLDTEKPLSYWTSTATEVTPKERALWNPSDRDIRANHEHKILGDPDDQRVGGMICHLGWHATPSQPDWTEKTPRQS
jgi:hypothetical protein